LNAWLAHLFDRLGGSVRLADAGKTFLPRARAVLHELEACSFAMATVFAKTLSPPAIALGFLPSGLFSSLLGLVGAGMGISLVPAMAAARSPDLKFVRIADSEATRIIGVLTLRGRSLSRTHQAFLSALSQPS